MKEKKKWLWLCVALIGVNVAFIWGNSLLPREASAAISRLVWQVISLFLPESGGEGSGQGHGMLRKLAHFTEFCSLGMLLCWLMYMLRQKTWQRLLFPLFSGAAVACIDETIQIFAVDRGPMLSDVGIDTAGVALGIAIAFTVAYFISRRKK